MGSYIALILYLKIRIFTSSAPRSTCFGRCYQWHFRLPGWYDTSCRVCSRCSIPTHPPNRPVLSLLDQLICPDSLILFLGILSWRPHVPLRTVALIFLRPPGSVSLAPPALRLYHRIVAYKPRSSSLPPRLGEITD
jgi:hypothetical protein